MEHDSSFNKQLRKEITARAVMNKQIKKSEVNIDENYEKIFGITREIKRIKKAIHRRKQKDSNNREVSSRHKDLIISKTDLRNKIDALKQISSHTEEVKVELKLRIKKSKRNLQNFLKKTRSILQNLLKSKKKIKR